MAKIGTAHVEIKPVVSDEALAEVTRRVADAVAAGVALGMARQLGVTPVSPTIYPGTSWPPGTITCSTDEG